MNNSVCVDNFAAKLRLFRRMAYRQILIFASTPFYFSTFSNTLSLNSPCSWFLVPGS